MIGTVVFISAWTLHIYTGQCFDIPSVEFSPIYDAIVFGDIAEIINDIDNNMNLKSDRNKNSESESNEEVESLLSEYQHYLEKAEKQRTKYFERTKGKNKVPLLQRERFSKLNLAKTHSNNRNPNYYTSNIQLSQKAYKHPYDLFAPMQMMPGETIPPFNKIIWKENKMNDFSNPIHKSRTDVTFSSCLCEGNKFPCKCNCKQCIIPLDRKFGTYFEPSTTSIKDNSLMKTSNSYTNKGYLNENINDKPDSNFNIQIKFDIQMPKIDDMLKQIYRSLISNKTTTSEDTNINEAITPMNVSFPTLNFPIPLSIFTYGVSNLHNYDYAPMHKMSAHKKKKTHTSSPNKKHRNKFLALHHGKGNPFQNVLVPEGYGNDSYRLNNVTQDSEQKIQENSTKALNPSIVANVSDIDSIDQSNIFNISTYVNVSSDDNIVEVDTTTHKKSNKISNITWDRNDTTETKQLMRIKREDSVRVTDNDTFALFNNNLLKVRGLNSSQNEYEITKRVDSKQLLFDSDLLYWPSKTPINTKNVTSTPRNVPLKQDFNISNYKLNSSTSWHKSLSKINWSDIDIAGSTFGALVGKYVNGILTFCSEKHCLSLKCAEKMCVYRNCLIEDRYNQRGHCSSASEETDSTISMESGLDVSYDIACELVETLQDQMLGFTYGKTTICINIKCISLVANKKIFTKTKCSKKQLNSEGHCESTKNANIV